MREGYITKTAWEPFVEALLKRSQVYAPCKEGETVSFRRIKETEEICLDRPAHGSPKGVIFPQSETLFTFALKKETAEAEKSGAAIETPAPYPESVILCSRPCDARGFSLLDRVFLDADPYYRERRERTTIITLSCPKSYAGCFCTSVGGGPTDKTGSDVLVTGLDGGYYIEVLTEKGESALGGMPVDDGAPYREEAGRRQAEVHQGVRHAASDARIDPQLFSSDTFWREASARCLGCGACTFLCPTCSCFNITDEQAVSRGERIRSWDSCMFTHFTLEASGHNPRSIKSHRLKNRVGHKFIWYPEAHGEPACTGCGRCIRHCPASVDISRIVALLARREEHAA